MGQNGKITVWTRIIFKYQACDIDFLSISTFSKNRNQRLPTSDYLAGGSDVLVGRVMSCGGTSVLTFGSAAALVTEWRDVLRVGVKSCVVDNCTYIWVHSCTGGWMERCTGSGDEL
jgi:hypothetical protein